MTSLVVAGSHPLMQKIRALASRLATCDTAALIVGEPGTGRTDLARHIHQQSKRAMQPFYAVDCTSVTSANDLVRSIEGTAGGTLFLADVESLDGEFHSWLSQPRGDLRIIASAESELEPESDLSGLLSRICLYVPPLRERRSDVPILIRHLLDKHASELDGPMRRVPDETLVLLWQYDWPGNLRELSDVVRECAGAAVDGVIRPNLLPPHIHWSFKPGASADRPGRLDGAPTLLALQKDESDSSILR